MLDFQTREILEKAISIKYRLRQINKNRDKEKTVSLKNTMERVS
mgnify:CR=1 FL=1